MLRVADCVLLQCTARSAAGRQCDRTRPPGAASRGSINRRRGCSINRARTDGSIRVPTLSTVHESPSGSLAAPTEPAGTAVQPTLVRVCHTLAACGRSTRTSLSDMWLGFPHSRKGATNSHGPQLERSDCEMFRYVSDVEILRAYHRL